MTDSEREERVEKALARASALADLPETRSGFYGADAIHLLFVAGEVLRLRTTCPICGHEWSRHDPEDGQCDAHSTEEISVCQCGRDISWMQKKIAALSTEALGGDENEIQPGLPDEHSEVSAFTPHGQRPPHVDREQIKRDAEHALLAWGEGGNVRELTENLARSCLTLLAELEQIEDKGRSR